MSTSSETKSNESDGPFDVRPEFRTIVTELTEWGTFGPTHHRSGDGYERIDLDLSVLNICLNDEGVREVRQLKDEFLQDDGPYAALSVDGPERIEMVVPAEKLAEAQFGLFKILTRPAYCMWMLKKDIERSRPKLTVIWQNLV